MTPEMEIKFVSLLDQSASKPFIWGENDCNILGFKWVDATSGTDWMDKIGGTYSNLKEAIKVAAKIPSWTEILENSGWERIDRNYANVGDIAVVSDKHYDRIHIVIGSNLVSVTEEYDFVKIPMKWLDSENPEFFRKTSWAV